MRKDDTEHLQNNPKQRMGKWLSESHLDSSMRAEVEVKLIGMSDTNIHCGTCWDVTTATHLHTTHTMYIHVHTCIMYM